MQTLTPLAAWLLALVACFNVAASDSRFLETKDFTDATKQAERYIDKFGVDRVLLVVDIDNTLLAMKKDLGSDQWFEWQKYLQDHEPDSPHLVAKKFPGLLEAQGKLFALGAMRPTQPDLPTQIAALQRRGVRTLLLTSRSPQFRSATQRELVGNGYRFAKTALSVEDIPRNDYLPYPPEDPSAAGFSEEEIELFELSEPRKVSYANGVFMTAGQHKGAMLLTMLAKARKPVDAVVFVDDHGRHVTRVYDALTRRGIAIAAVHYKREDANVNRFKYGDKQPVTEQWRLLDNAVQTVFD